MTAESCSRPTVADLRARSEELLPQIAEKSADRERLRVLPHAEIEQIASAGLIGLRIPEEYGGAGASVVDVIRLVVDLAAADSNIAQALRPAFAHVEKLVVGGDRELRDLWFPRILAGAVVGNAGWERGGRNGEIRARISRDGEAFRATGTKSYSTGALFADWVFAAALDDDGEVVGFTVPRDREGLRLLDDWDAMGQRLTASGTTHFDDLLVYPEEIGARTARATGKRGTTTPFLQLYLGAVEAGVARNALADAVAYTREHARPIAHSPAERSVDDAYVQHVVGEISSRAFAAEAVVLRAAESIDRAYAHLDDEQALIAASVDVAQAQFVAIEAALRAAELVFDVGGGSSALKEHNLDRHWRNARTVANHNPRNHKAAAVGAFRLTGAPPPTSGLF